MIKIFKKLGFKFSLPLILFLIAILSLLTILSVSYWPNSFSSKWLMSDLSTKCSVYKGIEHCDTAPIGMIFLLIFVFILIEPGAIVFGKKNLDLNDLWLVIISLLIYFLIGLIIDIFIKKKKKITPKGVI